MNGLHTLKEKLVDELDSYSKKELNPTTLAVIDTLAHATKNLCKVIEDCEEGEYSERRSMRSYSDGSRRSYAEDGRRYGIERGREVRPYSGHDGTVSKLEELREEADEPTRRAIDKALREIRG